jgi:hypothetical protein
MAQRVEKIIPLGVIETELHLRKGKRRDALR